VPVFKVKVKSGGQECPPYTGNAPSLAVVQAVADRVSGRCHVYHGGQALQAVMARLVEDIAEARYARSFAYEVNRQASGAAAEDARDGVQFLTAALQVVARHHKIAGAGEHGASEQQSVFAIPETAVAGRFRQGLSSSAIATCCWARCWAWPAAHRPRTASRLASPYRIAAVENLVGITLVRAPHRPAVLVLPRSPMQ